MNNLSNMINYEKKCPERTVASVEAALELNIQMQHELIAFREKLHDALQNVQETYKLNEELLRSNLKRINKGIGFRGAYLKGGTFFYKGNMFFKDLNCRNCPNNADYEYRSNQQNEMFPMDLELRGRHVWSLNDKQAIVQGIKEQVIQHIKFNGGLKKIVGENNCALNDIIDKNKLVKLLSMVDDDFQIDWEEISRFNVHYRHSPSSCEAIWNVYLKPHLKRSAWTQEENKKLLTAIKKYNFQNWEAIARLVGNRSDFQCFVQYQNTVCYLLPERWSKWSIKDDERLIKLVEENTFNGVVNWNNVLAHFPHKPKTTIQARYAYTLNPRIDHSSFTQEEDLLLLAAVNEYGTKFSCFPKNLFPNRTIVQLRNRYKNTIMHRHKYQPWTVEDDRKLLNFVAECGASSWLECEHLFGTHSRISCRTRFLTIQRFFKKNPDAKLEDIPRRKCHKLVHNITSENWTDKLSEYRNENETEEQSSVSKKDEEKSNQKSDKNTDIQKNKDSVKKVGKNAVKQTRLRSTDLKYYELMKYSYDYNPEELLKIPDPSDLEQLENVDNVTDLDNLTYLNNLSNCLEANMDISNTNCNLDTSTIKLEKNDLLPFNWCSAVGFRALCILNVKPNITKPPKTITISSHMITFRKRLRSLFFCTALLSRIHPNEVGINFNKSTTNDTNDELPSVSNQDNLLTTQDVVLEKKQRKRRNKTLSLKSHNKRSCNVDKKIDIEHLVEVIKTEK